MTTTLADKLLAAHGDMLTFIAQTVSAFNAAKPGPVAIEPAAILARVLPLAAAWHEVNGATLRAAAVGALTRARADLAAERKAWQEATEMESPPAAKGRIDLLIGDLTRARDCRSSLIGAREQAEQERNVAVVARGLAETAAKEATARAEAAEREVARLTQIAASNDGPARRRLDLAAPTPPPDASDEEIARALYAATAVARAYDDLPWSVTEPRQRAGWIAAVTTVIRPRLDALRADVARLTAPGPSSKCPADFASYIRDFGTTEGPYRLGLAHGRTESRAEVDRLTTALAAAEEACRLHERERDVAQGERDRLKAQLAAVESAATPRVLTLDMLTDAIDRTKAGPLAPRLFDALTKAAPVTVDAPATPSPRYVAVRRDEVNGRPECAAVDEETASNYAANCNAGVIAFEADDMTWPSTSYPWAVVDVAPVAPPAPPAPPRVEAFEQSPVCSVCNDTHAMPNRNNDGVWYCTSCPTPCEKCREPRGAYCAVLRCECECHTKHGRPSWLTPIAPLKATALATAEQARDALAANLAAAEEACRLHEQERDVAQAERDRAKEALLTGILEPFEDIARELHNDAGDLHERGKGSDHAVAVAMDDAVDRIKAAVEKVTEAHAVVDTGATPPAKVPAKTPRAVCPTHGDTVTCTCTTGAPHCHACGHTPPFCDECDDHHDKGAACATPPAALPQVEAFDLPAVTWKKDTEGNLITPFVGSPLEGWTDIDGKWNLSIDGTAPDEPTARARVEDAVAVLAGRAEVRR